LDIRDIAEEHRHVAARGDHGPAQVINRLRTAKRSHGPFDSALGDDAAGRIDIRLFDGMHHFVEADAAPLPLALDEQMGLA
jgi:hypothetical protein